MSKFLLFVILAATVTIVTGVRVDPAVKALLKLKSSDPFNIIINLAKDTEAILNQFHNRDFKTREERLSSVALALSNHATETQAPVLKVLNRLYETAPNLRIRAFWISNQISVRGALTAHIDELLAICPEDIGEIRLERKHKLAAILNTNKVDCESPPTAPTWGISRIEVRNAWTLLGGSQGEGIIVSSIDTGVLWTHAAIKSKYRTDGYGWYDPEKKTALPKDLVGHGTHTMGTMVGSPYIGVAPGARWMSCQGCRPDGCPDADLIACGQWILCPTHADGSNEDCSKAPNLVSNSWGGNSDDPFYQGVVQAWRTAGIVPIFAIGNSGPDCETAGSPGGYSNVIGVGATVIDNTLAFFSSRGPVPSRPTVVKPDVSAPGLNVTSAWFTGNNCYLTISGTSMATPHTAGVVALMLSFQPNLDYTTVRTNLVYGCTNANLNTNGLNGCPDGASVNTYPNDEFGQGLINARRSIVRVQALQ